VGAAAGAGALGVEIYANSDPFLHHIVSSIVPPDPFSSTIGAVNAQITAFGDQRKAPPYIGTADAQLVSDY
jgi:hypothetical protein